METIKLLKRNDVVVKISDYGIEWYVEDRLIIKTDLIENLEEDVKLFKEVGFIIVE